MGVVASKRIAEKCGMIEFLHRFAKGPAILHGGGYCIDDIYYISPPRLRRIRGAFTFRFHRIIFATILTNLFLSYNRIDT